MIKRIIVFGDSIAWGRVDNEGGGWVNRLQREYTSADYTKEVQFFNLGISGDKIRSVNDRIRREFLARNPDLVILAVGINDSPHETYPKGTRLSTFRGYISDIKSKVGPTPLIIVGLTRLGIDSTSGYKNSDIEKYDQMLKSFAKEHGHTYIDVSKLLAVNDYADGLHPNTVGHVKLYSVIGQQLVNAGVIPPNK